MANVTSDPLGVPSSECVVKSHALQSIGRNIMRIEPSHYTDGNLQTGSLPPHKRASPRIQSGMTARNYCNQGNFHPVED